MIHAPLRVNQSKKKYFTLNLNQYRNAHYFTLNTAKINYKEILKPQIEKLPVIDVPVEITYKLFPATKHLTDVANVCSIHDKFFCDALVELGKLEEDNYLWIPSVRYLFGEIDRSNPRVEISIIEF